MDELERCIRSIVNKKMTVKLKKKVYKTVVRVAMAWSRGNTREEN